MRCLQNRPWKLLLCRDVEVTGKNKWLSGFCLQTVDECAPLPKGG